MTSGGLYQSTFPSVLGYFKESLNSWKTIFNFEDSRGGGKEAERVAGGGKGGQVGRRGHLT